MNYVTTYDKNKKLHLVSVHTSELLEAPFSLITLCSDKASSVSWKYFLISKTLQICRTARLSPVHQLRVSSRN